MRKIFYNPSTLEVMGMSDGHDAMDYPFIETEEEYHSTLGLGVILNDEGTPELKIEQGAWEESVPEQMVKDIHVYPEYEYYPPGPPEEEPLEP